MSSVPFARRVLFAPIALAGALAMGAPCGTNNHEPVGRQTFASPQSNPIVLSPDGNWLFVANTTSNTVSVISTASPGPGAEVEVGVEPVGLAVKPDGSQLWVSNHVSDSVSVVDINPASPSYLSVVQTIQSIDANGVTQFDEPVGIAFASNSKAYVALSSRNRIAVVNASTYQVTGSIAINAQDPRAITVRNGMLYVAAFESSNQTELSVCPEDVPGPSGSQCTLDINDIVTFVITSPNIPGEPVEIVADPEVPDRDLFVFDTFDESPIAVVPGVSTLLYGLAVDGDDRVFVTATDARNDVNGVNGDNLIDLENRMFDNQVVRIDCSGGSCGAPTSFNLEPDLPAQPADGEELATPFAIAISGDDTTVVATAMGTSRLFTLDPDSGAVIGILDLDDEVPGAFGQQIPKGIALRSDQNGAPYRAYVLNTLENTVSVVDVSNPAAPDHLQKFGVGSDPTLPAVRRGHIAFANAFASSSGTFSCESCHPDGNTDQLLWRIGGACSFGLCSGDDEARSTMPIRGLKNTLPLHWDGTLGDPFGGSNGAVGGGGNGGTDCVAGDADGDHDCFVDLVNESQQGVMCDQAGGCDVGPSGHPGLLTLQERDDMARFLASVQYPPARSRRLSDQLTTQALDGFEDFFVDVGSGTDVGDLLNVTTCADMDSGCHALPLGVDDNSSTLAGFDAPTMRGMTDRFIHFSLGITTAEESLVFGATGPRTITLFGFNFNYPGPASAPFTWNPSVGYDERSSFQASFVIFQPVYGSGPEPMFQMFEEASTGYSGSLARQVQLNQTTAAAGSPLTATLAILNALQTADARGSVNLRGVGRRSGTATTLSYRAGTNDYRNSNDTLIRTQAQLVTEAQAGTLNMTMTASLSANFGSDDHRQPLLSVTNLGNGNNTNPDIPFLPADNPMELVGIDVRSDAAIFLDGAPRAGTISCVGGSFTPYCSSQVVSINLSNATIGSGLHMLQVQNPQSALSAELPVCGGTLASCR
jgi:YVTN family beta-propeller protein